MKLKDLAASLRGGIAASRAESSSPYAYVGFKLTVDTAEALLRDIQSLEDDLARRSDPGRVEVPELEERDLPYPGKVHPGSYSWQRNKLFAEGYNLARHRSRLSPSPQPSADVVVVPREEWRHVTALARIMVNHPRIHNDLFLAMECEADPHLMALHRIGRLDALRSSTNHDSKET